MARVGDRAGARFLEAALRSGTIEPIIALGIGPDARVFETFVRSRAAQPIAAIGAGGGAPRAGKGDRARDAITRRLYVA